MTVESYARLLLPQVHSPTVLSLQPLSPFLFRFHTKVRRLRLGSRLHLEPPLRTRKGPGRERIATRSYVIPPPLRGEFVRPRGLMQSIKFTFSLP